MICEVLLDGVRTVVVRPLGQEEQAFRGEGGIPFFHCTSDDGALWLLDEPGAINSLDRVLLMDHYGAYADISIEGDMK